MEQLDLEWQKDASCRGVPLSVFFHDDENHSYDDARAICASCPVMLECQDHAMAEHELYGFWGGLTEVERRSLVRRRNQWLRAMLDDIILPVTDFAVLMMEEETVAA